MKLKKKIKSLVPRPFQALSSPLRKQNVPKKSSFATLWSLWVSNYMQKTREDRLTDGQR